MQRLPATLVWTAALVGLVLIRPVPGRASGGFAPYDASDASAPVVTESNVAQHEAFWPYRVMLRTPLERPGAPRPVRAGALGVLLRVEPSGEARIDFGRDGVHLVPPGRTDLVERANGVRTGRLEKLAPNFTRALAPRMLSPGASRPQPYDLDRALACRRFLAVFADPESGDFPPLAGALAALAMPEDVEVVLFPQGRHPDPAVARRLRELGWPVPFVYAHLSEPYTHGLLPDTADLPAVLLQTAEGRVLFEGGWSPDTPMRLEQVLRAAQPSAGSARTPRTVPLSSSASNDQPARAGRDRAYSWNSTKNG